MAFAKLFSEIYRLYVTDGVPASGAHEPNKLDIQAWGATVEAHVNGALTAARTVWVRADATGDTGRDGSGQSTTSAFKTWQAAIDYVDANIEDNGFDVTFRQVESGVSFPQTYAPASGTPVISLFKRLKGGGSRIFQFRDAAGNDDDVRLNASGAGNGAVMLNGDPGIITIRGKVRWTSETTTGLTYRNSSSGRVFNEGTILFFGNVATHFQNQQDGAYFSNDGTIKVDGDCVGPCFRNDSGTFHDNDTIHIEGNNAWEAFFRGDFFSQAYLGSNITQNGSNSGKRIDVRHRAAVLLFADVGEAIEVFNDLPGDSRGNCQPGALVHDMFWNIPLNEVEGTVTFAASASAAVTFASINKSDQPDTNYDVVVIGGSISRTYTVEPANRNTTGFTITASASNSDTVHWRLKWKGT